MNVTELLNVEKAADREATSEDMAYIYKKIRIAYSLGYNKTLWPAGVPKSSWVIKELTSNGFKVKSDNIFVKDLVISWNI